MNVIFDINKVYALIDAYKSGRLGGEKMPEDENPIHCGNVRIRHIKI